MFEQRNYCLLKCWVIAVVGLVALAWCSGALAQGPPPPDFYRITGGPLRGSMALGNMFSTKTLGMGGASHAIEGPRSINPAALGWTEEYDVELMYQSVRFNEGPHAWYYYGEVTIPMPVLGGGLKLMGLSLSSDEDENALSTHNETHLWGREFGFAYGRYLTDRISIGASGFPSDPSEIRMEDAVYNTGTPGTPVIGQSTVSGRAQSQVGSIRAGTLVRVLDEDSECMGITPGKLNFGATYTHIIDEWKTRGLPAGADDDDTAYINVGGVGVSYEPCEYAALVFDYQFGHIGGVDIRDNVDLINLGGEVRPIEWMQLRVGSMDSKFTAGVGLTCPLGWQVDYAYVDGGYEDTRDAFGRGLVHSLAVSKKFGGKQ